MKTVCLIAICLIFIGGCVSASYNAETKEIKYSRLGDQKAAGIKIKMADGTSVDVESLDNTGFTAAVSAINAAFEMGVKAATIK